MNTVLEHSLHAEVKFSDLAPGAVFFAAGRVCMKLCDRPALDVNRDEHYFNCGVNAWKFDNNELTHFPDDAITHLLDAHLRYSFVAGKDL